MTGRTDVAMMLRTTGAIVLNEQPNAANVRTTSNGRSIDDDVSVIMCARVGRQRIDVLVRSEK
eukprot:scaffold528_cov165-Amphora_coffeaeformis.AAC.26